MSNIEISREEYCELLEAKVRLDVIRKEATTYEYQSDLVNIVKAVLGIEKKED